MTSPIGPIDTAFVEIKPDDADFERDLRREVNQALRGVERDVDKSLRNVRRRVAGALSGVGSALTTIVASGLKLTLVAAAVGAVSAALAGLASAAGGLFPIIANLAAALASAAGAAAALPGLIAIIIGVVSTLKIGLSGLGDAMEAVWSGDAVKLQEALKKLAPNARKFVKEIAGLKKSFDQLKLRVQNELFRDLNTTLIPLIRDTLPQLSNGFTLVANAINRTLVTAVQRLNTVATRNQLSDIFVATASAVRTLGTVLQPVVQTLLAVAAVGAEVISSLSGGVATVIGGLATRIQQLAASGELRKIILDGVDALRQFGALAGDVFGVLRGIFGAAGAAEGGGIFGFFERLNTLVNRPDVQRTLTALFTTLSNIGTALTPVLVALGRALVPVAQGIGAIAVAFAPTLVTLATQLGAALAALAPGFIALAPAVAALGTLLAPIAKILVDLVTAAAPGLTVFIEALGLGLELLAPAASSVGQALGDLFVALAPLIAALGPVLARALVEVATLVSTLALVFGPLIDVLSAVADEIAHAALPVLLAFAEAIRPIAQQLGAQLGAALAALLPVINEIARVISAQLIAALPRLLDAFTKLIPIVTQVVSLFAQGFLTALTEILPHLPELISAAVDLAIALSEVFVALAPLIPVFIQLALLLTQAFVESGLLSAAIHVLTGLIVIATGIFKGIAFVINTVITATKMAIDKIFSLGRTVSTVSTSVQQGFGKAKASVQSFVTGAQDRISALIGVIKRLPSTITSALGNLGRLLFNAGANLINGLINGIQSAFGRLRDKLGEVTSLIPDWKGPLDEDRRLLVPAGREIMRGLGRGFDLGLPDLRRQLESITTGIGDLALTSPTATGAGTTVAFGPGAVQVVFEGAVPTRDEARRTGEAVGAGIAATLARRNVRAQVRTV